MVNIIKFTDVCSIIMNLGRIDYANKKNVYNKKIEKVKE